MDEDSEAGSDERGRFRYLQLGAVLGSRYFTVGSGVAEVGDELAGDRDSEPEPVRMNEPVQHPGETDLPGQPDQGSGRERGSQKYEQGQSVRSPLLRA